MLSSADKNLSETHTINFNKKAYGKVSALYGANASGKSNFIKAITFIKHFLINSNNMLERTQIQITPFKFDLASYNKPSSFEIAFVKDRIKYEYGFTCDKEKVHEEFLNYYPNGRVAMLFKRRNVDEYEFGNLDGHSNNILKMIKSTNTANKLFLATAAIVGNIEPFKQAFNFLHGDIVMPLNSLLMAPQFTDDALDRMGRDGTIESYKEFALRFIKDGDFNIENFERKIVPIEKGSAKHHQMISAMKQSGIPDHILNNSSLHQIQEIETRTFHNINGELKPLFIHEESEGTQTIYSFAPLLYDVLKNGKILFVDEIEKGLHPMLVEYIVKTFTNKELNKNNAQIVFSTHSTNFLDLDLLRRDQIWFFEKSNKDGATNLYSLTDFSPRNNENIQKGYLIGRYGAVPFISNKLKL